MLRSDPRHSGFVSNSAITDNGSVGIFMRDSRDNMFQGLEIRNHPNDHGIFLAQPENEPTKPAAGNTFSGVVVSGSGGAGLRVNDASCVNNIVVGSQFVQNVGGCVSAAATVDTVAIKCH